eukprot:COSAG02_NODE_4214_length_5622_cov_4.824009_4_plen_103_part_00
MSETRARAYLRTPALGHTLGPGLGTGHTCGSRRLGWALLSSTVHVLDLVIANWVGYLLVTGPTAGAARVPPPEPEPRARATAGAGAACAGYPSLPARCYYDA